MTTTFFLQFMKYFILFFSFPKYKFQSCFILSTHQGIYGLKLKHILYYVVFLFLLIVVQVQQSPCSPYHSPPTPTIPTSHLRSYLPLTLSMGPLYMFLDDPSKISKMSHWPRRSNVTTLWKIINCFFPEVQS